MYKGLLKYISRNTTARRFFSLLYNFDSPELHREVMDLPFRSPVGMGPGFDTEAQFCNALGAAGCAFTIVGPLSFTRRGGIRAAVESIKDYPVKNQLVGFAITKEAGSISEDDIARDFLDAFDYSYDFSDFTVLDFSNPDMGPVNDPVFIKGVTDPLLEARLAYDSYHPVLIKLNHTVREDELWHILDYCLMNGIDGVMVSGDVLIKQISDFTKGRLPIIAEARIGKPSKASELIASGASLIAIQSSPVRFKPSLQKAILKSLKKK